MICHVSFGTIETKNPEEWLKSVPYFTRVLSMIAERTSIVSVHFASITETVSFNGVTYKFIASSEGVKGMTHLARSLKPDVIILHGFHSSFKVYRFVTQMKEFKIFIQHHGEKVFSFPKTLIQKRVDNYVKGYFFSAKELSDVWIKAALIRNASKIIEIPEVTSSFAVDNDQTPRYKTMNFIWVGRLDANKDPITLIDGFISFLKFHPEANLFMVFGTTKLLDEVQRKTQDFKNNIHLIGKVPHNEMPKLFAKANYIISTSFFEAGAVAVLEGMSCGCIPILSEIPLFKRFSNHGKVGLQFRQGSPTELSNTLVRAMEVDIFMEREKVIQHFESNLSARSIANQIVDVTLGRKELASASH